MRENCVTKQESRDITRGVAWVIVFQIGKREDPGDEVAVNASAFSAFNTAFTLRQCQTSKSDVTLETFWLFSAPSRCHNLGHLCVDVGLI